MQVSVICSLSSAVLRELQKKAATHVLGQAIENKSTIKKCFSFSKLWKINVFYYITAKYLMITYCVSPYIPFLGVRATKVDNLSL